LVGDFPGEILPQGFLNGDSCNLVELLTGNLAKIIIRPGAPGSAENPEGFDEPVFTIKIKKRRDQFAV
jgi:hypothetical protein